MPFFSPVENKRKKPTMQLNTQATTKATILVAMRFNFMVVFMRIPFLPYSGPRRTQCHAFTKTYRFVSIPLL